jgi:hypothetical protein
LDDAVDTGVFLAIRSSETCFGRIETDQSTGARTFSLSDVHSPREKRQDARTRNCGNCLAAANLFSRQAGLVDEQSSRDRHRTSRASGERLSPELR